MVSSTAPYPSQTPRRNPIARWLAADTLDGIRRQRAVLGYLFLAPALIGLVVFVVGPMIGALGLSFYKWNVFKPPTFIGLTNFSRLFADARVFISFKNTFELVVMTIVM